MTVRQNVTYPFSPGLIWSLDRGVVVPDFPMETFLKIIHKENRSGKTLVHPTMMKNVTVICPGYLLEAFMLVYAKQLFDEKGFEVTWAVPDYYKGMLRLLGFNFEANNDNVSFQKRKEVIHYFKEYHKYYKMYPVPIFFDIPGNVYYNLFFNYYSMVDFRNRNMKNTYSIFREPFINFKPFYEQMLANVCNDFNPYPIRLNKQMLKIVSAKYFAKYGIKFNRPYVLYDYDSFDLNWKYKTGKRYSEPKYYNKHYRCKMKDICDQKGYDLIVMNDDNKKRRSDDEPIAIRKWYNTPSQHVLSTIALADVVITGDINVGMIAALLGCNNVIYTKPPHPGFHITYGGKLNKTYGLNKWSVLSPFKLEYLNDFL